MADLFRRLHHRLARFAGEGRSEFGHVHDNTADAVLSRGVWIRYCIYPLILRAVVFAGPLCEADKSRVKRDGDRDADEAVEGQEGDALRSKPPSKLRPEEGRPYNRCKTPGRDKSRPCNLCPSSFQSNIFPQLAQRDLPRQWPFGSSNSTPIA